MPSNDTPPRPFVPKTEASPALAFVEAHETLVERKTAMRAARHAHEDAKTAWQTSLDTATALGMPLVSAHGTHQTTDVLWGYAQGYRAAQSDLQPTLDAYADEEQRCRQLIGKVGTDQPLCSLLYDRLVFQGLATHDEPASKNGREVAS